MDITDSKLVQIAIQSSEAKFRNIANKGGAMVRITDATGHCNFLSKTWYEFTGQAESEGIGFGWLSAVHPDDRALSEEIFLMANENRSTFQLEYRLRRWDGEYRWMLDSANPWIDEDGDFRGYIGSVLDINDRKTAEKKLEESREMYRQIVEHQTDYVIVSNIDREITFSNLAFARALGKSVEETIGTNWVSIVFPEELPPLLEKVTTLSQATPKFTNTNRIHSANNQILWTEWVNLGIFDEQGSLTAIHSIGRDVTEKMKLEELLKESEERYRLTIQLNGLGTFDWQPQHNTLFWNQNKYELLGLNPNIPPSLDAYLSVIHPDDRGRIETATIVTEQEHSPFDEQYRVVLPDGQIRWLGERGEWLYGSNGFRMFGIVFDITDRKHTQIELEKMATERTASLQASQLQLQQQLEREQLLLGVTQRIYSASQLEDILNRSVQEIRDILNVDRALIYQFLPDRGGVTIAEALAPGCSSLLGVHFALEVMPQESQQLYCQGRIGVIDNLSGVIDCVAEFMETHFIKSKLVIPLLIDTNLWGLLVLHHCKVSHSWQEEEVTLGQQLATTLSIAIRQSELNASLEEEAQSNYLLAEIALQITYSDRLQDVLNYTLEDIRDFLAADRVIIYRFLPDWSGMVEHEVVSHSEYAIKGQMIDDPCFAKSELITSYENRSVSIINDVDTHTISPCHRELLQRFNVKANLVAPILHGKTVWGLVIVHNCRSAYNWTPIQAQFLQQAAISIGIAGQKQHLTDVLKSQLTEKDTLFKEIHHRVKNNLQIIISLMRLQVDSLKDKDEALVTSFQESQNRIQSMALIHERLYQSDNLSQISAQEYFKELTDYLARSYNISSQGITINLDIAPLQLEIDKAIPCGLITNELLTNSIKYAFPESMRGIISLTLQNIEGRYCLEISDNGVGFPPDFDLKRSRSLGLRLVSRLTSQLRGELTMGNPGEGSKFTIIFPP